MTGPIIIGAGFAGLAAGYELALRGLRPRILEASTEIGGLAADEPVGNGRAERFYHHWFTSDTDALELVRELGLADRLRAAPTRTAIYTGNRFWRLSTPLDLLTFSRLPFLDRLRLGCATLRVRRIRDWRQLENRTAAEWLREVSGEQAYRVVWEPLLRAKFGRWADQVSAVWMWNKLVLRGGSRDRRGREELRYLDGGFGQLAKALAERICSHGGMIMTSRPAIGLRVNDGFIAGVDTPAGPVIGSTVLATIAPPLLAPLVEPHDPVAAARLASMPYLASLCIVLELDRPLSREYWLNVNDPGFPFVAVIEHTNFADATPFAGRHVVYLARYLDADDADWRRDDATLVHAAIHHLQRMFPRFGCGQVLASRVHRARWAQPVILPGHARRMPPLRFGPTGLHLASMAQIYPEDRGTSYAIRSGRHAARVIVGQVP